MTNNKQNSDAALAVLGAFDLFQSVDAHNLRFMGNNGGFSGAELWQFESNAKNFLLRRWPTEANDRKYQLAWINEITQSLNCGGCGFIAAPLVNRKLDTLTEHSGFLWQVEPWLPGRADFWHSPSDQKLQNVMVALAKFHLAATEIQQPKKAVAPAIEKRLLRIEKLKRIDEPLIRENLQQQPAAIKLELLDLAIEVCHKFHILAPTVSLTLRQLLTTRVEIGICLCDVWHDHVLFTGDNVSGIVDYGAMSTDSIAVDVSRLIGSLVGDDTEQWKNALRYFEQIRVLSPDESNLVSALDRSTTLISGMNWIDWIYSENREFEQIDKIKERIRRNIQRADLLQEKLGIRLLG